MTPPILGKKVLGNFMGAYAGGKIGRTFSWSQTGKFGRVRNPCSETRKGEVTPKSSGKLHVPDRQMERSNCLEKTRFSENPRYRIPDAKSSEMVFEENRVSTDTVTDDGEARSDFGTGITCIVISLAPKEESFPVPVRYIDVGQENKTLLWTCCKNII